MPAREAQASWATGPGLHGAEDDAADSRHGEPAPSGAYQFFPSERLARAILLTVLCAFVAVEIINVLDERGPSRPLVMAVSAASICVLFTLQVLISSQRAAQWPPLPRAGLLAAEALVTYLPLLVVGSAWGGMAGWFAGSLLLLIPGWTAWALFSAVILSMLAGSMALGFSANNVAYFTVASLDTGLVVFGLSRLTVIISYLQATRAELAQLAVIRERMRFARDLHDLLGYSLSAITLKAELTRRLVGSNPCRARDEVAELLDIARQALADVRLVASGYRNMSLSKEAATAGSLLSAVGVRTDVGINCGPLDERVDTALATTLREAVTNMLRHAAVQNCTIKADVTSADAAFATVRLLVANDGAPSPAASRRDGGGLENLAARLEAVGGRLTVSRHDDRFEILATVTVPAAAPPGDATAERAGA